MKWHPRVIYYVYYMCYTRLTVKYDIRSEGQLSSDNHQFINPSVFEINLKTDEPDSHRDWEYNKFPVHMNGLVISTQLVFTKCTTVKI